MLFLSLPFLLSLPFFYLLFQGCAHSTNCCVHWRWSSSNQLLVAACCSRLPASAIQGISHSPAPHIFCSAMSSSISILLIFAMFGVHIQVALRTGVWQQLLMCAFAISCQLFGVGTGNLKGSEGRGKRLKSWLVFVCEVFLSRKRFQHFYQLKWYSKYLEILDFFSGSKES